MVWLHLPIRDVSTPSVEFEAEWPAHSKKLRGLLDAGENVLVHCKGGLGRAGMISARLLVESGIEPEAAIAKVRKARPGAIQTQEQEVSVRIGPRNRSWRANVQGFQPANGRDIHVAGTSALPRENRLMHWFERLTGFREGAYRETEAKLAVDGRQLRSLVNGKSYGIGDFELVSLQTLRERAQSAGGTSRRLKVSVVTGDVRRMHQAPEYAGALFQVASQFNALEMTGPHVTPEHGVTRYMDDHTQDLPAQSRRGLRRSTARRLSV